MQRGIYSIAVHEDGTVDYRGDAYVKERGYATWMLSAEELRELHEAFASVGYLHVNYNEDGCMTDLPHVLTSYRTAGGSRSINHYLGCVEESNRPLLNFEFRFDEIVRSERLVGSLSGLHEEMDSHFHSPRHQAR